MSLSTLVLIAGSAHAELITVDDDGKADFNSIQAAIEYAAAGDEILVAPGVYTSDHPLHVVDMLGKALTLRGSGEQDATIVDGESVRRGIVCLDEENAKTVIEGITIRNGVGVEHDFDSNGTAEWWESSGGGMLVRQAGPTITDCRFIMNSASRGGGLSTYQSAGTTLTDCTFAENSATQYGGGFYNNESTLLSVKGCVFVENSADVWAGGMYNALSSPRLIDCTFRENHADNTGGGLMNHSGSSPELTECTFIGNATGRSSQNAAGGGMVNYVDCSPSLLNCTFSDNSAVHGGGIWNYDNSNPTMTGCRLEGNAASRGGGMYNRVDSSPTVLDCVFTENLVDDLGGGIYSSGKSSRPTLTDITVCGNAPDQISGDWLDNGGNVVSDTCRIDCLADFTQDGVVDGEELTLLLNAWGTDDPMIDVNDDGTVDDTDLTIILTSWGACR